MPQQSEDEIIARIVSDPRYWIERSLYIVDQNLQRVPFVFNGPQNAYYDARSETDIILKARKMGFSSSILAVAAHQCAFKPHTRVAIVGHEEAATERMLKRVGYYIENSDIKINARIKRNEIFFPDTKGYMIVGTAGATNFGRGDDFNIVHLTESAHYESRDMIGGIQEAMVKGKDVLRWIVQETTAKGAGNSFHRSWLKAIAGTSGWKPHFFPWFQERLNRIDGSQPFAPDAVEADLRDAFGLDWDQLAWRRHKLETMADPDLFVQEHPATWEEAFLTSGKMVFDWRAIKRQEDAVRGSKWIGHLSEVERAVTVEPDPKGPLTIWLSPSARSRYIIVCDAADGVKGGAYSVGDVYEVSTWEQVAQFRGHPDPVEFADIVMRMGVFYGMATLACENNYPGNAVIARWSDAGYPNIYDDPSEKGDKLGWTTTSQSRPAFIADGRAAVKDGSLKINSSATLTEMRTFILTEGGKMTHQVGCWSDTIITSCKAVNILKGWISEPELQRPGFREAMGFKKRRGSFSGGEYNNAKVI